MNNKLTTAHKNLVAVFLLCAGLASPAYAQLRFVEPDDYTSGTDVSHPGFGISLSTLDSSNQYLPFPITATYDSFHYAPTGTNVFGHAGVEFFNSDRRLRIDFSAPTDLVSLAFAGGDYFNPEIGELDVFNSSGTLLGSYVTSPHLGGSSEVMSLSRATADIAFAIAYEPPNLGSFGRLDALQFDQVPEPSSALLALLGAGLCWRRPSRAQSRSVR